MNIVLFSESELSEGVVPDDRRVLHVQNILAIPNGQSFDAGVINGMRGKATFLPELDGNVPIQFVRTDAASDLYPVDVVVGLSRPQTCRFVLRSLASLGVRSIEFVLTESGQRSYASSQLWSSGEYLEIVTNAVAQAFETKLPSVRFDRTLLEAITANDEKETSSIAKVCLDNYEATSSLASAIDGEQQSTCLLIGTERGWSDNERSAIRSLGFVMSSMGGRVLRVETASVAAVSVVLARQFWSRETGTLSTRK